MSLDQEVLNLLESHLRPLSLERQIDVLSGLASTGEIEKTVHDMHATVFHRRLAALVPQLDRATLQDIAKRLITTLVGREVDRRTAREQTHLERPRKLQGAQPIRKLPQLTFSKDQGSLASGDLAEFLDRFNTVYAGAAELAEQESLAIVGAELSRNHKSFLKPIQSILKGPRRTESRAISDARELLIVRIRKSSPLTMSFEAIPVALSMAVIISGGEVDLSRGKFKIHALGEGLEKLRQFFRNLTGEPQPKSTRSEKKTTKKPAAKPRTKSARSKQTTKKSKR